MTSQLQVKYIVDAHVYDSEETLVALLELALVEYLHCNDRGIFHSTTVCSAEITLTGREAHTYRSSHSNKGSMSS